MQPAASIPTDEERKNKYTSLDRITEEPEFCIICKQKIEVMSFKGTAVCSTNCTKVYSGESIEQKDNHPKGAA